MRLDVRLYLVTDPSFEDLERVVAEGVAGGVTCVQVRDKHAPPEAVAATVERLRRLVQGSGVPIISNDIEAGADGVHVGTSDETPSSLRSRLGPDALIGWSINDLAQLADSETVAACDYLAVSPVFATPTKSDTGAPFGVNGVSEVARRLGGQTALVGIGGLGADNAGSVVRAGADGVAVVRALGAAPDPRAAATRLRSVVDSALEERTVVTR